MDIKALLKGEKVKLTSLNQKDLPIIEEWYEDNYFLRLYDLVPSFPKVEDYIYEVVKDTYKPTDNYAFAIRETETGKLLGTAGLHSILWNHGVSWLYIGIGEKDSRGKGYGKETLKLLLEFAFLELNLHRIQLNVFSYNERAIAVYEKVGFVREGCYREFLHRDGRRYDMYLYSILRHEWEKLYKE